MFSGTFTGIKYYGQMRQKLSFSLQKYKVWRERKGEQMENYIMQFHRRSFMLWSFLLQSQWEPCYCAGLYELTYYILI